MRTVNSIVLSILFLSQFSCTNSTSNHSSDTDAEIKNGDVKINFSDSKNGDTTLFFIHGWNINQTYWSDQKEHFSTRYRVVTMDLPGFGASGNNRKNWTVEEYGRDISTVIQQLDLKNVILIGHSMSGALIVEAASTNPSRVIGIIGIDNFTNFGSVLTEKIKKDIAEAYMKLKTDYRQVILRFANESLFSPSTDSTVRKRVITDFLQADSAIAIKVLEENDKYPLDARLKATGKKLYLINSDFHPTDTLAFKKNDVPFLFLTIGPTGHYPMIEKPAEFNSLLRIAIRDIGSRNKNN